MAPTFTEEPDDDGEGEGLDVSVGGRTVDPTPELCVVAVAGGRVTRGVGVVGTTGAEVLGANVSAFVGTIKLISTTSKKEILYL